MMYEYELDIITDMFLGILDREKERKNRVRILLHYRSSNRPDYSQIYNTVMDIINEERFGYMEDCAEYIHRMLQKHFSIDDLTVTLEKMNPLNMDKCKLVRIVYGP